METDDELGMAWWNGLSEAERARWARLAGTGRPVDPWAVFKGHGAIAAFLTQSVTEAYGEPLEAAPALVPEAYRAELARLSRAELMDVAWHLAQLIHDFADDAEGDMIELRCASCARPAKAKRCDPAQARLGGPPPDVWREPYDD
jgi:hypothetical protein